MYNHDVLQLLKNLTSWEEAFKEYELKGNTENLSQQSILQFLESHFIKESDAQRIYFYQAMIDTPKSPVMYAEDLLLDESYMLQKGVNVIPVKHMNFTPFIMHECNYFDATYILSGSAHITLDSAEYDLKEGDFLLKSPKCPHGMTVSQGGIMLYIMMRRSFINNNYLSLFEENPDLITFCTNAVKDPSAQYILFHTKPNDQIPNCYYQMFEEYVWGDEHSPLMLENCLRLLSAYLTRYQLGKPEGSVNYSAKQVYYLQLETYLKHNYRTASLESASAEMHFSKQYICSIARQIGGTTFSEMLMGIRLDKVKTYLADTSLSIEKIAELTGFANPAHLSHSFKKSFGLSPSAFRQKK